ncbi:hypothetical protein [Micromonospora peucetia]|uniref:hypothetical protein n=1 Tax=Micromonospora peucetia TaxID=47871 RepID=UPI00398D4734
MQETLGQAVGWRPAVQLGELLGGLGLKRRQVDQQGGSVLAILAKKAELRR